MVARLTKEDRLQRVAKKLRQRVDKNSSQTQSLHHCPSSILGVLVREAGYERTGAKMLDDLDKRLKAVGVGSFPELTDPSVNRKTRIHFFDLDKPLPGFQLARQLFAAEKELSRFIWMNRAVLPYVKKSGLRIRGQEVRIADDCIVDLLAEDRKTGELVGIELKAGHADDRLVGQAAKYMRALAKQASKEGKAGARLLIVTGQPDESLSQLVQQMAEKYLVKTQWLLYSVSIDLFET